MKVAVMGGTGRIGSLVVEFLNAAGHEAVPHARSTGVNLLTGEGLDRALAGAGAVVDVTSAPAIDDSARDFFQTTTGNLVAAGAGAGVRHAVVLSIVGADLVPDFGYYRAKVHQENVLASGPVPFTVVRATQFFEFVDDIMSWTTDGDTVRLPATQMQPIAAADVARDLAGVAVGAPLGGTRNIAGPDVFRLDELGRITLAARGDSRTVTTDATAGLFATMPDKAIIAKEGAHITPTHYRDWLRG
ncbi:SDR family oxidoreductase [Streptomyces sp. NPDC051018]|uniref:SDR family oxidoreductase n=1 Tax=Streptomyces sp. NPDC051018 TaxID=3365639 RepID=UPI0037ADAFC1